MAGHHDSNLFGEEEVNPFADQGARGRGSAQPNYGGGAFYTTNPGSVPPPNSMLSPLPPERADYDRGATVDIPLDSSKDLRMKEKELQAKEAELKIREQEIKRREDAAAQAGIVIEEKNWPPFLPIIHHDIANEIPIHLQKLQAHWRKQIRYFKFLSVCHLSAPPLENLLSKAKLKESHTKL